MPVVNSISMTARRGSVSGRAGASVLDFTLAAAALILLPISVVAFFAIKGWVAFIPLGFIIVCMMILIVAHLWRMFRDFKRRVGAL
jgi:hypothetical protein